MWCIQQKNSLIIIIIKQRGRTWGASSSPSSHSKRDHQDQSRAAVQPRIDCERWNDRLETGGGKKKKNIIHHRDRTGYTAVLTTTTGTLVVDHQGFSFFHADCRVRPGRMTDDPLYCCCSCCCTFVDNMFLLLLRDGCVAWRSAAPPGDGQQVRHDVSSLTLALMDRMERSSGGSHSLIGLDGRSSSSWWMSPGCHTGGCCCWHCLVLGK